MYATGKDTRFRDKVWQRCRSYYFPYNSNDQKQVEGNYMAKSLWSAMQEYISDLAGRSFISCNCMKMDTAIVRTFALITSVSLTFRAVKCVLLSRFLCGNNGSSQQLQFKVFFTIPWLLIKWMKECSLTCNWGQILINRQDLTMVY